jgi:hypothetical protein
MLLNVDFNVQHHRIPVEFNVLHHRIPVVFKSLHTVATAIESDPYTGTYEITPTEEDQTLETNGKLMSGNVVVKAIPEEYGRVTYDNRKVITIT